MKAIKHVLFLGVFFITLTGCDIQQAVGPEESTPAIRTLPVTMQAHSLAPQSLGSFTVGVNEEFTVGNLTGELTDIEINEPDADGDCDITLYEFWYEDDVCGGSVNYAFYGEAAYGGTIYLGESKFRELSFESDLPDNAGFIIRVHDMQASQATIEVWSYTGVSYTASGASFETYNLNPGDHLRMTEGRVEFQTIYWNGSANLRYRERTSINSTSGVSIIKNEYRADKTFFDPSFEIGAVTVNDLSMEIEFKGSP